MDLRFIYNCVAKDNKGPHSMGYVVEREMVEHLFIAAKELKNYAGGEWVCVCCRSRWAEIAYLSSFFLYLVERKVELAPLT